MCRCFPPTRFGTGRAAGQVDPIVAAVVDRDRTDGRVDQTGRGLIRATGRTGKAGTADRRPMGRSAAPAGSRPIGKAGRKTTRAGRTPYHKQTY